MDSLLLTTTRTTATATNSISASGLFCPSLSGSIKRLRLRRRNVNFRQRSKFSVLAAKEEPQFDKWDLMELKFGKMLGEDPKLTLAKIMGRKINPDATYLEIEKEFYKRKGKMVEVKEVPFDVSDGKKSSSSSDGLNLVRPVPKKGVKFETNNKPSGPEMRKPSPSVRRAMDRNKSSVPNVILRKPTVVNEDDVPDLPSKLRMKPNLSLKMRNDQTKEKFSDMTLLKKPETLSVNMDSDEKEEASASTKELNVVDNIVGSQTQKEAGKDGYSDFTLLGKPKATSFATKLDEKEEQCGDTEVRGTAYGEEKILKPELNEMETEDETKSDIEGSLDIGDGLVLEESQLEDKSILGMQPTQQSKMELTKGETSLNESSERNFDVSSVLQKPTRLDPSVKEREEKIVVNPDAHGSDTELMSFQSASPLEEHEDSDWTRAEGLVKTGERADVEIISASTRGFAVSFGSLIGFLPYRNLAAKWKFLAFESWLRHKGLDPSKYKQNLGVIGNYDMKNETSTLGQESSQKQERQISADMNLDDLLQIYDQEKLKFLSSFVGQKINVMVVMADKKFRKLIFSVRPREKEELVEKKRSLMARLRIGDVVKCCIKKITYFGVFVEFEGVTALIHQTEVSWDTTLDPASYFKIGQVVEAKVHQLDFTLERIFLSLKEITPDPLSEALESVVGGHNPFEGKLEAAQPDTEWADVESLIKELHQIEGIESVSKGRYFLSPGLAPTFQVYMASMFENQYKLLARSGNQVQEVIVQTSLDKEEMKSTILSCANRVE